MKKQLLIIAAIGLAGASFAQVKAVAKPKPAAANKAVWLDRNALKGGVTTEETSFEGYVHKLRQNSPNPTPTTYTKTVIGTTGYQLQTNAAICNRMVKSADGTISATWTMSQLTDGAWADRGTGYNYFDGTSWGPQPTVRIENTRTGFTNIGITNTGAEFVVTHEASDIHVASRPTKGTGAWTNTTLGFPDVWSRLAVGGSNGKTLHVISQTTGTANPAYQGQDGAIAYSRSLDGGLTWDKLRTVIPQIDSSSYLGFGGDSYAIDAKGDTIVIVAGGFDLDVVLIKSIDNGNTWTKTVVHQFPIPFFDAATMITDTNGDAVADTIESNDAAVAVLLDNQGKAHVWYGRMRVLCDAPGTGTGQGLSYFPYTDGLMYWNENMGAAAPVMIAAVQDINSNGQLDVYVDGTGATLGFGQYFRSLSSFPNAGIDAAGNIYVAYASIYEGNAENGAPADGKSYFHTYVIGSNDGGTTWTSTPVDVADPMGALDYIEGVYPAMAKDVDNSIHLIYQEDNSPGHGVSTATSPDPQSGPANIVYVNLPTADVFVGVNENEQTNASINVYPNPTSDVVNVSITTKVKANAVVSVYNVVGQKINEFGNNLIAGTHTLSINTSSYDKGIYFITANIEGKLYTQKVIIK